MDYVLKTNFLSKKYFKSKVLDELSVNIPKGSIYGLVGKNGAGKTTFIRIVCGLQEPTSGDYEFYGVKNTDKSILKCRKRLGAIIEGPALYPNMTARENLRQKCRVLGLPDFSCVNELLKMVDLENTNKKIVKNFSLGMKQRLAIAMALCGSPDFLVLDEPINGLDPQGIIEVRELLVKLNKEHQITILISSHILDELSRIATHYGFIDRGKLVREMDCYELENECRKKINITVTNIKSLVKVLDEMKIKYKIISDTEADIYDKPKFSDLVLALHKENCEVISVNESSESLESFFISLVGGMKYE